MGDDKKNPLSTSELITDLLSVAAMKTQPIINLTPPGRDDYYDPDTKNCQKVVNGYK
jgi:hypothetical protein